MASRIQHAGIRPSLIMSSPAVRAWTTAKVIAEKISYPFEFLQRAERLYHANARKIIDVLAEQDIGFNSILMVGHNPGFTEFANQLVPGLTHNIPTCGFVSMLIDSDDWHVKSDTAVQLITYDYPKKKN